MRSGKNNSYMGKQENTILLESQIVNLISERFKESSLLIENNLRFTFAEFDIILLDPKTLSLVNIEVKRNNWSKLYEQALRGKLFCHYSLVIIPWFAKEKISIDFFKHEGIGVVYYLENNNYFELKLELHPRKSETINRNYKKILYKHFSNKYQDLVYA